MIKSDFKNVEAELIAIENKYSPKPNNMKFLKPQLTQRLTKLEEELNSLGIINCEIPPTSSKTEVLEKVVDNTFKLVHICRKLMSEIHDIKTSEISTISERYKSKEHIAQSKSEIDTKIYEIKCLNEQIRKCKYENEAVQHKNKELQKQVKLLKSYCNSKQNEYHHKLGNLQKTVEDLQDKCGQSAGKFISRDTVVLEALNKYRTNEEIYKDTILQLQNNNRDLLEQIVNFQEEITCNNR